jgi:RNA polymerase sigma-70 factor (ECF subfamily)
MAAMIGDYSLGWFDAESACDEVDITNLVATYSGLLYRVAYSILRQPAEAEDVVQETFLRVMEQKRRLSEIREPKQWLVRIAWNLALDRKRRVTPAQMDEVTSSTLVSGDRAVDEVLAESLQLKTVVAALDRLPEIERKVLLLSAVEELTTAEIAGVVGRSESSVRSIAFRARQRLQERLRKGAHR